VFLFSVCFFSGNWWLAAVFGLLALATLTRFAIAFIIAIIVMWMAWRRGVGLTTLALLCVGAGLLAVVSLLVLKNANVWLPISLDARTWYWTTGYQVFSYHPVIGTPRSDILQRFNLSIVWTPCNGFLWVAAVTGLIGAAAYFGFVSVALGEMRRMASTSGLWAGLFVGFVTLLTWSFFEPIVLTPTFDVLLAAHYAIARSSRRLGGSAA
jgi:hypothetical protein